MLVSGGIKISGRQWQNVVNLKVHSITFKWKSFLIFFLILTPYPRYKWSCCQTNAERKMKSLACSTALCALFSNVFWSKTTKFLKNHLGFGFVCFFGVYLSLLTFLNTASLEKNSSYWRISHKINPQVFTKRSARNLVPILLQSKQ